MHKESGFAKQEEALFSFSWSLSPGNPGTTGSAVEINTVYATAAPTVILQGLS